MKENVSPAIIRDANDQILTRARAAALRVSRKALPPKPTTRQNGKGNLKRSALDRNNSSVSRTEVVHHKRRAVLQDVTNVCCENTYRSCFNASKIQAKNGNKPKSDQFNMSKLAPPIRVGIQHLKASSKLKISKDTAKRDPKSEISCLTTSDKEPSSVQLSNRNSDAASLHSGSSSEVAKFSQCEHLLESSGPRITDIDNNQNDPQLCSLYVADIYNNLRVAELVQRILPSFMETIQSDITPAMRGILVDWLVEVAEEYKLEAETLYLTIYFIDWYLSICCVERHRLQLLGITCMLIASKYEEISAPRIVDFCFITDNTYTRAEVLKMESQVLKCFGFQLFAPTTKTFLTRFLRAAQACYSSPSYELEYLADYLAELTLLEYSFLNFIPSIIAASAVFLARWTLDQTRHPWNLTLEHYTSYKALDLKPSVLALQDLQSNSSGCPLVAIRSKYRQQKYKSVAALSSQKLLETLF